MKSKLRHPIRAIREPFGKAGLIVACLALVFAMVGGAYAAGKLTSKQKKEVEKIAKKFAGKPGAPGTPGAQGPAGAEGKQGPEGSVGPEGKAAKEGKEGSPWTAGGTLPSGKTETGSWGTYEPQEPAGTSGLSILPISFTIPLAAPLNQEHAHLVSIPVTEGKFGGAVGEACQGKSGTELEECEEAAEHLHQTCPGGAATPKASSGNLCVYRGVEAYAGALLGIAPPHGSLGSSLGADTAGAELLIELSEAGTNIQYGTWAVTG